MQIYDPRTKSNLLYHKVFLGCCTGIALSHRNKIENDNHIVFSILVEDDGNWFVSNNLISSFWLDDLREVMGEVMYYLENSDQCMKDTSGYGWAFK